MAIKVKLGIVVLLFHLNNTPIEAGGCNVDDLAADVVVLLDASGSMGRQNFEKQVDAVHKLVEYFKLGPQNLQVGTVTFSSSVRTEGLMNRYHEDSATNKKNTLLLINYIKTHYEGKGTETATALRFVMDYSFTAAAGDRPGVPNILIVMTDGASDDKVKTLQEAAELHKRGIICIPIGIGNNKTLSIEELRKMATNESYVYILSNFDALDGFLGTLKDIICDAGLMASTTLTPAIAKATTTPQSTKPNITKHPLIGTMQTVNKTPISNLGKTATTDYTSTTHSSDNLDDMREYLAEFRSSPLVKGVEVGAIAAVFIVGAGAAICCCKRICPSALKRKKDDDEEEKIEAVSPSQSSTGYLNSAKRLNNFVF